MRAGTLPRRYARALLDLAIEQNQLEKIERELADLGTMWRESRELRHVFENPAYGADQRKRIVLSLAERTGLSPLVRNTLLLLSDRRRTRFLGDIIDAYQELAEERAGRVRAEVTTATSMPESYYAELQKQLEAVTGRKVVLVKKQDPTLIAGVVTRVGDKVFDGSLKNRLAELREQLLSD